MHTVTKQQFHIKSISSCDKVSDAENLLLCVTCTKGQQLYKHYPKFMAGGSEYMSEIFKSV